MKHDSKKLFTELTPEDKKFILELYNTASKEDLYKLIKINNTFKKVEEENKNVHARALIKWYRKVMPRAWVDKYFYINENEPKPLVFTTTSSQVSDYHTCYFLAFGLEKILSGELKFVEVKKDVACIELEEPTEELTNDDEA